MRRPRRNHTATFKAKVAIAALKDDETLAALAEKFGSSRFVVEFAHQGGIHPVRVVEIEI